MATTTTIWLFTWMISCLLPRIPNSTPMNLRRASDSSSRVQDLHTTILGSISTETKMAPCAWHPNATSRRSSTDTFECSGPSPRRTTLPLEHGDHPEIDDSKELDIDGIKKDQSLIGSLQWVNQIGRFDITTAVMTLASFRANPRQGHLDRAKRIYGYLYKYRNGAIRLRTAEPDYSALPDKSTTNGNTLSMKEPKNCYPATRPNPSENPSS